MALMGDPAMLKKTSYFIYFSIIVTFSQLFAQSYPVMRVLQKDFPGNTVFGFVPACGVGSFLLPRYSWLSTTSASAINSTFSPSAPTSTTMNTSECRGPKRLAMNDPMFRFVSNNLEILIQNIAAGDGEALNTLGDYLKIPSNERSKWKSVLKNNYGYIVPTKNITAGKMLDRIASISIEEDITMPLVRNYEFGERLSF